MNTTDAMIDMLPTASARGRAQLWLAAAGLALAAALPGCAMKSDESAPASKSAPGDMAGAPEPVAQAAEEVMAELEMDDSADGDDRGGMARDEANEGFRARSKKIGGKNAKDDERDADGGESAPARSWFPETFLFEPLVVTDPAGSAQVTVRIPDRLTSWRVLGLAHSRQGAQAGAVTSFLGTLPAYVDPVVPERLRVGDRVRLPVTLVNNTDEPLATRLTLTADSARVSGADGALTLAPRSSAVRYADLRTDLGGRAYLRAQLGADDAVIRPIAVAPVAMPHVQERRGTLAQARVVTLDPPANRTPDPAHMRLLVFPGALSILRTELAVSMGRSGAAEDAFALLVAGMAKSLLSALHDDADADAARALTIIATQRIVRHARTLDVATATLLTDALAAHPQNPVLSRLAARAVDTIESGQRPDGTCGNETGWSLRRTLVATADCARAVETASVKIRAAGVIERHAERIDDAYTAASILAAGVRLSDAVRKRLLELVNDAIEDTPDGAKVVAVPANAVRADGARPSEIEASALAVLALMQDAPKERLAALGATVLAGYSPQRGWGDGRASLLSMKAVLALFRDPIPPGVTVSVVHAGVEVANGRFDTTRPYDRLVLEATLPAAPQPGTAPDGASGWEIRSRPAVPGLSYAFTLTHRVPWPEPDPRGLTLAVEVPDGMRVGNRSNLVVSAAVPSEVGFHIALALPAGVQVDNSDLDALQAQGVISRYRASDGQVELWAGPLPPAQVFQAALPIVPTLAGTVHSGAHRLSLLGAGGTPAAKRIALSPDGADGDGDGDGRTGERRAWVAPTPWVIQP